MTKLNELINDIHPIDEKAVDKAWRRLDSLAKPPRSLGKLEEYAARLSGITGRLNNTIERTRLIVLCADNGVTAEGVSSAPQSVTLMQTLNLARGVTGAAVIAAELGMELEVVDVGVNTGEPLKGVLDRKIRLSTGNIFCEPAMRRSEAERAILTGIALSRRAAEDGCGAIGVGEMGIGNTTTSSAVLSALCGVPVEQSVGKGGGLTPAAFEHKKRVVKAALSRLKPGARVLDVLAEVGGLDLCAMAGVFIGAAICRVPVVIDGFISAVAAVCAHALNPKSVQYMFASHRSFEIGYSAAMSRLGLEPMLDLRMRLGEGSGCPLAVMILKAACAVMNRMATFEQAEIDDGYLEEIRNTESFRV